MKDANTPNSVNFSILKNRIDQRFKIIKKQRLRIERQKSQRKLVKILLGCLL